MKWLRADQHFSDSDCGYRVSVSGRDGEWVYTAWGPEQPKWKTRLKMAYTKGDRIPQPRELIGCYPTPGEAAQACEDHKREATDAA